MFKHVGTLEQLVACSHRSDLWAWRSSALRESFKYNRRQAIFFQHVALVHEYT
jgi:hypothetical protein